MTTTQTAETSTATRIGQSDWHLAGICKGSGECDHCGRELKNLYSLRNAATGKEMIVGRGCCVKVTGWTLTAAEAQRMMVVAEMDLRRAANWARFTAEAPELAARIEADMAAWDGDDRNQHAGPAHQIHQNISDGRVSGWEVEYAEQYTARATSGR